ncbi:MAG: LytR/AlgR family response regulator transcription factor [Candidatus Dormibacteria bacterium]
MTIGRLVALVVDDEEPARNELVYLLQKSSLVKEVEQAEDAETAQQMIKAGRYDVVFLDVRMPRLDGIGLARLLARRARSPHVVFVTAFEQYALDAFGVAAFDYLVKPVRSERLKVTLNRLVATAGVSQRSVAAKLADTPSTSEDATLDMLAVYSKGQIRLIAVADISVAEVEDDKVYVRAGDERLATQLTLTEIERRYASQGFVRVHRRYVVNFHHVDAVEPFFNNTYLLKLRQLPSLRIPVSRRHGRVLRQLLHL